MTKDEYDKLVDQKHDQIRELEHQIDQLTKQYCEENSSLKIGDKIRFDNKQGIITSIRLAILGDSFEYVWKPLKKDGSLGCEKLIRYYQVQNIEKI